jgi:hypothetical protein
MTDPLRAQLIEKRPHAIDALRRGGAESGELALQASVQGALAAIEAEAEAAVTAAPQPGDRAIVTDDGERIMLTVYSANRRAAAATVSPAVAIYIVSQLITAALSRLR